MTRVDQFTILIVDDDIGVRNAMKRSFASSPYSLLIAEDGPSGLDILAQQSVDLVLLDLKMPGMDGLAVLSKAMEQHPDLKVIMLTGYGSVDNAVEAMKLGALDFIEKTISPELLKAKIKQIYSIWHLEQENQQLHKQLSHEFHFAPLIGESPPMHKLKDMITRIAPTSTSILIQGESGTGKELVAQAIHHHSNRKGEAFIPVDCAAINETVMESEFFGHTKGAFTGAEQSTLGLVRSADKGTLFLDEVGELSLTMQAKLLRTIQERMVRPVGSTKMIPVDIRILAATNRPLATEITDGSFRQDLYYRLSAVTLQAPPLRERGSDIQLLARHIAERLEQEGLSAKKLSAAASQILNSYHWPGNVRELENVLRSALAFGNGELIEATDLPTISATVAEPTPQSSADITSLSDYEAEAIRNALDQSSGNRRQAAQLLGVSEATLYRRIKQYDM